MSVPSLISLTSGGRVLSYALLVPGWIGYGEVPNAYLAMTFPPGTSRLPVRYHSNAIAWPAEVDSPAISIPKPHCIAAGLLFAYNLAASIILSLGTQVIFSTISGGNSETRSISSCQTVLQGTVEPSASKTSYAPSNAGSM